MDSFEAFVKDFLDGKLEAYLKSEPVPASQDEPVKVLMFFFSNMRIIRIEIFVCI
jgi:hypothetical protein